MPITPEKDVSMDCTITFGTVLIDERKIINFTLPAVEALLVDLTDQENDTGFFQWATANLKDAGKFAITVFLYQDYDPWAEVGTEDALVITLPSGTTITCNAILESYTPSESTLNERMLADAVFQLSPNLTTSEPLIVDAGV